MGFVAKVRDILSLCGSSTHQLLVKALFVEPRNLALGKVASQSSVSLSSTMKSLKPGANGTKHP